MFEKGGKHLNFLITLTCWFLWFFLKIFLTLIIITYRIRNPYNTYKKNTNQEQSKPEVQPDPEPEPEPEPAREPEPEPEPEPDQEVCWLSGHVQSTSVASPVVRDADSRLDFCTHRLMLLFSALPSQ